MIAVCWPLNWFLPGFRTQLLFFPLWLGYALTVDALVSRRSNTSLIARSPWGFVLPMSVGALVMSASTIIVALNAQLLRGVRLREEAPSIPPSLARARA